MQIFLTEAEWYKIWDNVPLTHQYDPWERIDYWNINIKPTIKLDYHEVIEYDNDAVSYELNKSTPGYWGVLSGEEKYFTWYYLKIKQ